MKERCTTCLVLKDEVCCRTLDTRTGEHRIYCPFCCPTHGREATIEGVRDLVRAVRGIGPRFQGLNYDFTDMLKLAFVSINSNEQAADICRELCPYKEFCRHPTKCVGNSCCQREYACDD